MSDEAPKFPDFILSNLRARIHDPVEYVRTITGKQLKREFKKLTSHMQAADEVWEWDWFGSIGPRPAYSIGWCVIRGREIVASHVHSTS